MQGILIFFCALLMASSYSTGFANFRTFVSQTGTTQNSLPVVAVTDDEAMEHLLTKKEPVRLERGDGRLRLFLGVQVEVSVDVSGNVASVKAISGPQDFYPAAIDLARNWKFKPFVRKDKPIAARFVDFIAILPREDLPTAHIPFPEVHNWNSLRIKLSRSSCYGTCPDYSVEIRGDGSIIYTGKHYVAVKGTQRGQISMDALRELVDAFRAADYYSLQDEYISGVTDNPTYATSISIDGNAKTVVDYVGLQVGMPQAVKDIEEAIDRIAGTSKWIGGKGRSRH
jgi:hypothetical protein